MSLIKYLQSTHFSRWIVDYQWKFNDNEYQYQPITTDRVNKDVHKIHIQAKEKKGVWSEKKERKKL